MDLNYTQTLINDELKKHLDKDVYSNLIDALENIEFARRIISPTRGFAKDRPKDIFGKIIVDIVNPHILEDMDYFRPAMLTYEKNESYTNLTPNAHPMSEYSKFWMEEAKRCREGLVRESDGEWITGLNYFYWNYSPILKSVTREDGRTVRISKFPDIWDGDYLYFHYIEQARTAQKHGNVLKSRGKGFSYKGAGILGKFFILGDRQDPSASQKKQKAFAIANEKEFLTKDAILNKFLDVLTWTSKETPWPRNFLKESMNDMHWRAGYINSETGKEEGVLNEVVGVTLKNDPDKARGKRAAIILWEEMGKFPDLLKAWGIARPSVEDGDKAFGTMISFGTGGTSGADFRAAEEMFYNPSGYNILGLQNVFDKNVNLDNKCAFFFPEYINRSDCYDANGNSDIVKALIQIFKNRAIVRYGTSDPNALTQEKAERPICPQEAILRKEGSLFPISELKDYVSEIMPNIHNFVAPHYVGRIGITSSGATNFILDPNVSVIREFPLKDNLNKAGAVEIFQQPVKLFDGSIPRHRYIMGVDPVDDDYSQTTSLVSAFVFDRFLDKIVAEFTGRPRTAVEAYDIIYRLARHYNATINYENDKKGLFAHFSTLGALHYLCETPSILRDMEIVKEIRNYGNKALGTPSGATVNAWGRRLQADWLVSKALGSGTQVLNEAGELIETDPVMNLHRVRSIGYLKELIAWNPDGNFDRISAMGMVMIYRQHLLKYDIKDLLHQKKTIYNDPFFSRYANSK